MNHRELLKKYMKLIMDWESVSFLDHASELDFTEEELEELKEIEKEVLQ